MMQQEMTLTRWLFNPFIRIAGTTSLVVGLGAIGIVALLLRRSESGLTDWSICTSWDPLRTPHCANRRVVFGVAAEVLPSRV